jgi:hypothetical protein
MIREELEKRMDELAQLYAETHDPKVKQDPFMFGSLLTNVQRGKSSNTITPAVYSARLIEKR